MHSSSRYESICIDGRTAGLLSSSEMDLVRFDALISKSQFMAEIRQQLLRIEALSSASIDGRRVKYLDLLKLETAILNSPFTDDDCTRLYRLASKLELEDASGAIVSYRYMRTVDWVARNITKDTVIDSSIFETIRDLYNENEIEAIANPEELDSLQKRQAHRRRETEGIRRQTPKKEALVDDYIALLNSNVLAPSAQAEISHAQLQLIKPYEGNLDAYERVFSHMVFYRRGALTDSIAPLAIGPARNVTRHVQALVSNMEGLSNASASEASMQADFLHSSYCTEIAVKTAYLCQSILTAYWQRWQKSLDRVRSDSATLTLAKLFLGWPCLTIAIASEKIDRGFSATNNAMKELAELGIVREISHLSKHRLFCAVDLAETLEELLEKAISSELLNRDEILGAILQPERPKNATR